MGEERVMHPKAKMPLDPLSLERPGLIANLEEAMVVSKAQDRQLKQFQQLIAELKTEIDSQAQELKQFEIFRPILKHTKTFYTAYIRDPILITQLQGRVRQKYGKIAKIESIDTDERKLAHRLIDDVIEECVRFSVMFHWHNIQQRLEDKQNAQRPQVT